MLVKRGVEAIIALAALAALVGCGDSKPQAVVTAPAPVDTSETAPAVDPVAAMDYAQAGSWLCRPESQDACEQVAAVTRVAADGRLTKEMFTPASDPPIDCLMAPPYRDLGLPTAGSEEMESRASRRAPRCARSMRLSIGR
jgi:hypothetical protein